MKRFAKVGALLFVMAAVLTGCNCYNKLGKKADRVQTSCNPSVLTLKGSSVTADVTVTFPKRFVERDMVFRMTPVLVFEGGEIAGTPKYVQGQGVKDNYTVIPYSKGGSYTQTVSFPYDSRAKVSTLEVRMEAMCCRYKEFRTVAAYAVAQGVSAVQEMADQNAYLSTMANNFKRSTSISKDANIMYLINSAKVRPVALSDQQVKLFENFVKDNTGKEDIKLGAIQAKGYASPDGPEKFNDKLSRERSQTGKDAVQKQLKGVNATYDAAAYGEDWDGFKSLVEASDIQDKNLILQVLNMYSSSAQRDQEIKNMSEVYDVLKKDILPQLRRTQMVAVADIPGKTDAELKDAVAKDLNSLSLEEMLFAATLYNDNATQQKIYKAAADKYNDARAYNNYGTTLLKDGKLAEAKAAFEKAASIKPDPEISNNLGVVALQQGNLAEAKKYLSSLSGSDAAGNKALVAMEEGDYAAAARGLQGYDLAVAEVANGNLAQAKAALTGVETAKADYLRGVISMREGNTDAAIASLKKVAQKDPALAKQAKTDIEFAKIFGYTEFIAL